MIIYVLFFFPLCPQAHLRAIDVKLMHQLLSINEGIESIRWLMEERGGVAGSRGSSLTGSLYSLSDSQESDDSSQHGGSCDSLHNDHDGCDDGLDGISVGSYLDTLGEDLCESPSPTDMMMMTTNGHLETTNGHLDNHGGDDGDSGGDDGFADKHTTTIIPTPTTTTTTTTVVDDEDIVKKPLLSSVRPRVESDEYFIFA